MTENEEPRWRRVFARGEIVPSLESLRHALLICFPQLECSYRYDDTGWIEATLQPLNTGIRWTLSRYTRADDDIRGDLQSWAAWVETRIENPHRQMLMEHLTATRQVFTFQAVPGLPDQASIALCRFLAHQADGVYQLDGMGFFNAAAEALGFID